MLNPSISWFERFRPTTVNEIVFSSEEHKNLIKSWIDNERIPGNVLLSGPAGTGKTTTSIVLIKSLIKNQSDLCRIKSRSVSDIDDKIVPFIVKKPLGSKSKIVYIEELDRMSRQAFAQLKEDLMEKYQEWVSFICCTNYPKRIDTALRSRFTFQIEFQSVNLAGIKSRLELILKSENAKFDQNNLDSFIEKNYRHGLRNLINSLQVSFISNNGTINFDELEKNLNIEDNIVSHMLQMTEKIMVTTDPSSRKSCLINPLNSIIAKEYSAFTALCHNNYDIDYSNIFERLMDTIKYVPLQGVISKYAEEIEMKKYPYMHLIACFYEMIKCALETVL